MTHATLPRRRRIAAAVAALCVSTTSHAASEAEGLEQLRATTLGLIQALVDQGLLSRDRADALLKQAQVRAPVATSTTPSTGANRPAQNVVRVPYVPETVRAQIKEEIKNEVMGTAREEHWADPRQVPSWTKRITVDGELRVRAEGDVFSASNTPAEFYRAQTTSPAWSPDLTNTQNSRQRLTLRGRLGVTAKVSDDFTAGVRLTTDGMGNQASQSQTLGTNFKRLSVAFDRAYVRWAPRQNLRFDAGRMQVPFYGTDLLWPEDLSVDGVAVHAEHDVANGLYVFANAGAFPLEEFASSKADKWLYGFQVGGDWAIDGRTQLKLGLGVYDFRNIQGTREANPPPTGTRAGVTPYQLGQYPASVRQRGNTLINLNDPTSTGTPVWGLASRFRPWNLTAGVVLDHLAPVTVGLSVDWVKNSAFDIADIRRRAGTDAVNDLSQRTSGLQLRAQFGAPKVAEKGEWQGFVAYRKFERDAWVDAFTDTTWNLGGTNYRGYSLGATYGMDHNAWATLRWTSTRSLDDGWRTSVGSARFGDLSSAPLKIDVIQADLNVRF